MDVNKLSALEELDNKGEIDMDSAMMEDFLEALRDCPLDAAGDDEKGLCPQESEIKDYMALDADPLSLQQPILPAAENHATLAVPMYPPTTVQQPILPAAEHHAAPAAPMYPFPTVQQPGLWYNQAAPSNHGQFNNVPVVNISQGLGSCLAPVGFLNGEVVYQVLTYTAPMLASQDPPVNHPPPQKKKFHRRSNDESQPYIKKPQNAFMIYLKEQRPKVVAELGNSACATVNKVIGQKWKSLSSMEQAIYYEKAERERQLHLQLFPQWSVSDNYGKKRKRTRKKDPAMT